MKSVTLIVSAGQMLREHCKRHDVAVVPSTVPTLPLDKVSLTGSALSRRLWHKTHKIAKFGMLGSIQRFRQVVCNHVVGWFPVNCRVAIFYEFTDKVVPDVDVLRPFVMNWI